MYYIFILKPFFIFFTASVENIGSDKTYLSFIYYTNNSTKVVCFVGIIPQTVLLNVPSNLLHYLSMHLTDTYIVYLITSYYIVLYSYISIETKRYIQLFIKKSLYKYHYICRLLGTPTACDINTFTQDWTNKFYLEFTKLRMNYIVSSSPLDIEMLKQIEPLDTFFNPQF